MLSSIAPSPCSLVAYKSDCVQNLVYYPYMHQARISISALLCFVFLSTMCLSIFHISISMSPHHEMHDCPFMAHERSFCPIDLENHLSVWKVLLASVLPSFLTLFILFGSVTCITPNLHHLYRKLIRYVYIRYLQYIHYPPTYAYHFLQDYFSQGILHPKLY